MRSWCLRSLDCRRTPNVRGDSTHELPARARTGSTRCVCGAPPRDRPAWPSRQRRSGPARAGSHPPDRPRGSGDGWWPWSPPEGTERWRIWTRDSRVEALVHRGTGPVVVFLPQLDGSARVAGYVVRRLALAGMQVVAILPPRRALGEDARASEVVWRLKRSIRTARVAVRLARSDFGAPCVALVGLSFGGITSIPTAALESPDATVAMLAGGGLRWLGLHSADPPPQDDHDVGVGIHLSAL